MDGDQNRQQQGNINKMEIKMAEKCEILSQGKNKELALIWQGNTHNLEIHLLYLNRDQTRQQQGERKKDGQEEKC